VSTIDADKENQTERLGDKEKGRDGTDKAMERKTRKEMSERNDE
jgi:hypothetical protein